MITLVDQAPVNGHRPSVDVLFRSVAKELGKESAAVIMTGMGDDGATAMKAVLEAGGVTIAQSMDSCVVDSMPRAAIEAGYATRVASLENLPNVLQILCQDDGSNPRGIATELEMLRGDSR
jgi:two-component system chemotaxis response regulator CheB